jgi:2-polyprenyl-3-methyl-5-hydroxy-6-metoxy-1,4-benzoquinol methylase
VVSVVQEQVEAPAGFERVSCPGCDAIECSIARVGKDWALDPSREIRIVRCDACGFHYTNPRPTLEKLGEYYPDEYGPYKRQRGEIERDSAASTALRKLILRRAYGKPELRPRGLAGALAAVASWVKRPESCGFAVAYHGRGRLLDFGCGSGTFLRRMAALGWDVMGIDFSESAVRAVRESGLRAIQGSLPHAQLSARSFDVITMRQALEHLPNPREVLTAARELLDDGGLLVIQVPNFASWEIAYFGDAALTLDLPRHLLHLTPDTLRELLERCGFEVRSLRQHCRASWLRNSLKQVERRG